LITSGRIRDIRPTAKDVGKATRIDDAIGRYIVFCKNTFPDRYDLEGLKVVLDCANGATYKVAPIILSELGAEVTALHCRPNGININDGCGSQHTGDLVEAVRSTGADVGLAFDGDGDRMIAVDETGQELTGDHVIAICAKHLKAQGRLDNNLVVATVMANFGFFTAMKEQGIDVVTTKVGDRYVIEAMRERNAVLGGEASGHLIFGHHHTTGDGILSALQLLSVMRDTGERLSALASIMQLTPQHMINIDVQSKPDLATLPEVAAAIVEAEGELGDRGRVLIRYSGTQSMCRVMVEGPTEDMTHRLTETLADVVRKAIG
jgi:phosphoglucosamine mutase